MTSVVLTPVTQGSFLYTGPGTPLVFLLWDNTGSGPAEVPLDDTWSSSGPPVQLGYYLFLTTPPTAANASTLESTLRGFLQAPVATSCVWAGNANPSKLRNVTVLPITVSPNEVPTVAQATALTVPRGVPTVGFGGGMPVVGQLDIVITDNGEIAGLIGLLFVISTPSGSAQISLPLLGSLTGCLRFTGLVTMGGQTSPTSAVKQLVNMQLDPLNVFGPRTHGTFTGYSVVLAQGKKGYRFLRGGSRRAGRAR